MKVLLIDDHQMLTEALAATLSTAPDVWVLGQCATDNPGLAAMVARLRPDVIIIEVESVGAATPAFLGRLRAAWPAARIVVLTACRDPERAVDAARAGVDAWVPKESTADQLLDVLRGVCRGHASYPPEQLGAVLRELRQDVRRAQDRSGPLEVLSDRERAVLQGMIEGAGANQIAEELRISVNTVRTHVHNIFAKLDLHSRLEAAAVARAAGMRPRQRPPDGADARDHPPPDDVVRLMRRCEPRHDPIA